MWQTVRLYERCVIPGANYPEFWVRYVSIMEESGDVERAQDALTRATTIFVKVSAAGTALLPSDIIMTSS